nr:UDP-glucuronosyltransferase 1-9 [Halyomorpha halys]XP_024216493.1 UDP-glucuronosyltransferase 1-9 [Halyomorpha halys]
MKLWMLPLLLVAYTEAARILAFFPIPGKSHHYVFRPIMAALGRRGHEVVYYTGFPYERTVPPGIKQVDLSDELPDLYSSVDITDFMTSSIFEDVKKLFGYSFFYSPFILECPKVQKLIHSDEKFDVVLSESYFIQEYLSAFMHKFNAVGIDIISLGDFGWMNELVGLPDNPSYQVDYKAVLTPNMNFWERVYSTYVNVVTTSAGYHYLNQMENFVDKYFNYTGHESRPPFMQLLSNRSLILVNYNNVVGYPVPKPPHRKDIAGVTITPRKPLPKQVKKFMDDALNGVIYFSLGSNVNVSHPTNRKMVKVFMKVFEEVPQKILMKWETTTFEGKLPKNVHLEKWYPQQDVLAHNNTVLFITHGGYLSLVEAVHFGVPVIGIPYFGDQAKNFRFVEEAGIGKMLKLNEINYDNLSRMVKEVLSNKTYKDEMTRMSKMFRDRLVEPVDEAVFWIEHVIKYPDVLKPKALSMSYIQLHLIDVMLFVISVLLAVVFIAWKSITIIVRLFKRKSTPSKEKTS